MLQQGTGPWECTADAAAGQPAHPAQCASAAVHGLHDHCQLLRLVGTDGHYWRSQPADASAAPDAHCR